MNSRKSSTAKITSKASQNIFYIRIAVSQSWWWFKASLERFFTNEILFLVFKFVLNKIYLTWHSTKFNMFSFCCVFELTGWDVCFIYVERERERKYIYCILYKKLLIYKVNLNLKLLQFMWNSHALFCHNVIEMGDVPASLWELFLEINVNLTVLKLYTFWVHWKHHCQSIRRHALFWEELAFKYIVIQLFCNNLWTS